LVVVLRAESLVVPAAPLVVADLAPGLIVVVADDVLGLIVVVAE